MVTADESKPNVKSSDRFIKRPFNATETSSAADKETAVCDRTETDLASTLSDSSALSLMFLPETLMSSPAATLKSLLTSTDAFAERTCNSSPKNKSAV